LVAESALYRQAEDFAQRQWNMQQRAARVVEASRLSLSDHDMTSSSWQQLVIGLADEFSLVQRDPKKVLTPQRVLFTLTTVLRVGMQESRR
jgi:hypothetical protein